MVQIQAIGGSLDVIIAPITEAATNILNIQGDRIFINYELFTRNNWGMNGATF
jgi:phenylpyruvate tautomerase PptA (4-oxalocrotonate tautomerase family)